MLVEKKWKYKYKYTEDGEVIYRMNLEQARLAVSPLGDFEQRLVGVVVNTPDLETTQMCILRQIQIQMMTNTSVY